MKIYADYNATTPVAPQVIEEMLPYFGEKFGNPASSSHAYGWVASEAVEIARERISEFINCNKSEIVFTSGATESINLAIKGVAEMYANKGRHIVTVCTEHKAVLDVCKRLSQSGYEITELEVNHEGLIDFNQLEQSISDQTILVSIMLANNETGVIQDLEKISSIVKNKGALLFSDATQAGGKMRLDVTELNADLLCLSAHKMYGPKGCGILYMRRKNPRVALIPLIDGGGHEGGLRSGTLNVPAIVGFGKACDLAAENMWGDNARLSKYRTLFEQAIATLPGVNINGSTKSRLPNTTNLCFKGYDAAWLIKSFRDIAVSTGSACTSASMQASHVLTGMGLSKDDALSSVRFSFGKFTTENEINFCIEKVLSTLNK